MFASLLFFACCERLHSRNQYSVLLLAHTQTQHKHTRGRVSEDDSVFLVGAESAREMRHVNYINSVRSKGGPERCNNCQACAVLVCACVFARSDACKHTHSSTFPRQGTVSGDAPIKFEIMSYSCPCWSAFLLLYHDSLFTRTKNGFQHRWV